MKHSRRSKKSKKSSRHSKKNKRSSRLSKKNNKKSSRRSKKSKSKSKKRSRRSIRSRFDLKQKFSDLRQKISGSFGGTPSTWLQKKNELKKKVAQEVQLDIQQAASSGAGTLSDSTIDKCKLMLAMDGENMDQGKRTMSQFEDMLAKARDAPDEASQKAKKYEADNLCRTASKVFLGLK